MHSLPTEIPFASPKPDTACPGLLESVYGEALAIELHNRGLTVSRQVSLPISYKGKSIGTPLRIDLVVAGLRPGDAGKVVIECKAVSEHNPLFDVQTLTYLRLSGLKLGLVINVGAPPPSKTDSIASLTACEWHPVDQEGPLCVSAPLRYFLIRSFTIDANSDTSSSREVFIFRRLPRTPHAEAP